MIDQTLFGPTRAHFRPEFAGCGRYHNLHPSTADLLRTLAGVRWQHTDSKPAAAVRAWQAAGRPNAPHVGPEEASDRALVAKGRPPFSGVIHLDMAADPEPQPQPQPEPEPEPEPELHRRTNPRIPPTRFCAGDNPRPMRYDGRRLWKSALWAVAARRLDLGEVRPYQVSSSAGIVSKRWEIWLSQTEEAAVRSWVADYRGGDA